MLQQRDRLINHITRLTSSDFRISHAWIRRLDNILNYANQTSMLVKRLTPGCLNLSR